MTSFFLYVAPILLIAFSLALGPARRWLEDLASEVRLRADMDAPDLYQRAASRFLRNTDPERHAGLRKMVVWVGHEMVNGTKLMDIIVMAKERGPGALARPETQREARLDAELDELTPDAQHAFAAAIGAALYVSASQAIVRREHYWSILEWVLLDPSKEVKEPKQVVHRYAQVAKVPDEMLITA